MLMLVVFFFVFFFIFFNTIFFWGCGILLFPFTLLAPYNIYSFRKVNTCINNKNRMGGGGGLTVCICLRVKIGQHLKKVLC
ncbi:hypothetical protein Peur_058175 [Populus x canadensis]